MGRAPAEVEERLEVERGRPRRGADSCQVGFLGDKCRNGDWRRGSKGGLLYPAK